MLTGTLESHHNAESNWADPLAANLIHRPEAKERKREWVSVPEALARCEAWANERNTKVDLYMGFKQCRVHKRYLSEKQSSPTNGVEVKVGVGTVPAAGEDVISKGNDVDGRRTVASA